MTIDPSSASGDEQSEAMKSLYMKLWMRGREKLKVYDAFSFKISFKVHRNVSLNVSFFSTTRHQWLVEW